MRLRKDVTLLRAGGVMAIVRVHEDVTLVGKVSKMGIMRVPKIPCY